MRSLFEFYKPIDDIFLETLKLYFIYFIYSLTMSYVYVMCLAPLPSSPPPPPHLLPLLTHRGQSELPAVLLTGPVWADPVPVAMAAVGS